MTETTDFERAWLSKFSACLSQVSGERVRELVMAGSGELTSETDRADVIAWTRGAMARLESLIGEEETQRVMVGCACQYPKAGLAQVRRAYEESGDLDLAHHMLQVRFESFLRDSLHLDEGMVAEVVNRGWGLAGVRRGSTIIATKIPKSQYLAAYLEEPDPARKREAYCHCPRIRKVLQTAETLPVSYCYCGAGYYKGIWEEILQQPVDVEVLESVLAGAEVCRIAVHLPQGVVPKAA